MDNFGCNVGNKVTLGPTGTFPFTFEPFRELYNGNTLPIYYNNTIENDVCYITNPYKSNGKLCKANGLNGFIITFEDNQIFCGPKTDVPLDDIGISMLVILSILLVYAISKIYDNKIIL